MNFPIANEELAVDVSLALAVVARLYGNDLAAALNLLSNVMMNLVFQAAVEEKNPCIIHNCTAETIAAWKDFEARMMAMLKEAHDAKKN